MKTLIKATLIATAVMVSNMASAEANFQAIKDLGFPVDQQIELKGTNLPGMYLLKIGNDWVVGAPDSTVVMKGNIIDLKQRADITSTFKAPFNKEKVDTFPEDLKISYKPEGEVKSVINVLTDTSCPFCKKLHDEIPVLNKAGVEVRYIPFARGFTKGRGYSQMMSVWCSEDKKKAMDDMFNGSESNSLCLTQAVAKGYKLSTELGATGTPAIYLEDGRSIEGYAPAKVLLKEIFK